MVNVLFVCLGNICRSPMAEGVFRDLVAREGLSDMIRTDSAGTGDWHIGSPPDERGQAAAMRRGIDISDLRGRQARADDFHTFDYIIAMDRRNHDDLIALSPGGDSGRVRLFMDFAAHGAADGTAHGAAREIPDPYSGGTEAFEQVLDMIEAASAGLLQDIRDRHL